LSSALLLTSCSVFQTPEPEVVKETVYVDRQIEVKQRPPALALNEVIFYVVNAENVNSFAAKMEKEHGSLIFIAMSVRGYESMALNMAELRRYVEQQKEIIIYYEKQANPPVPSGEK